MKALSLPCHWRWTPRGFQLARSLPLADRGFRYGMAVFETLRVRRGQTLFLAEHLTSLRQACAESAFPVSDAWVEQTAEFLRRRLRGADSGVARIHVTAGDGPPGAPAHECRLLLGYEPRPAVGEDRPWRVLTSSREHHPAFGGRKTHNYWNNVETLAEARQQHCEETLLYDAAGCLVSASMGNVFAVVEDGRLLTPSPECGARRGIVRAWVCAQHNVVETALDRLALAHAREVFVTNSWIGVQSVAELDGRPLPSRETATALRAELENFYDETSR